MTKLADLSGSRFGELVVLRRGANQARLNGGHRTAWTCQCDCGAVVDVVADKLRRKCNPQRTCGHTQAFKDLSGQRFSSLTVRPGVFRRQSNGVEWFCDCDCGHESGWHRADHLLSVAVMRCSLCKRQTTRNARLVDLTGRTFGKLTVISRTDDSWGQKKTSWLCKCSCGNPQLSTIDGGRLKSGHTRSCGCIASGWDSPQRFIENKAHAESLTTLYFVQVRNCFEKFGIATDMHKRSRNAGEGSDYTAVYAATTLCRAEAWAVEQVCLLETAHRWQPAKIRSMKMDGWPGWTELRYRLDIPHATARLHGLVAEVKNIGWLPFLRMHAPELLANVA